MLGVMAASDINPLIAPIGVGEEGETFKINSDTAAGAIAAALEASRLLLLTDVTGVLDASGTLIPEISLGAVESLIKDGVITGGMIPKISTCLDALRNGVGAATILDGRVLHALLLEIFTEHGVGTLISAE